MKKIRLILIVIILWCWATYLSLFRKRLAKKSLNYSYYHYMKKPAKLVRWAYNIDFQVKGINNITINPQLIAVSHRSYADSTLMINALTNTPSKQMNQKPFIYIAKQELNKNYIFRNFIRLTRSIFLIERANLRQSINIFRNVAKLSHQENLSIVIFPEGTRNKTDKPLLELKPGALKLATWNKLPIVPAVFINNRSIWDFKRKKKIIVKLVYGQEIPFKMIENLNSNELCELVSSKMKQLIAKHQ